MPDQAGKCNRAEPALLHIARNWFRGADAAKAACTCAAFQITPT